MICRSVRAWSFGGVLTMAAACTSFQSTSSPDASTTPAADAAPDAPTGDPSLARSPRPACGGPLLSEPTALYPGSMIFVYLPMGMTAPYSLPWCASERTLTFDLTNPTSGPPSLTLMREAITQRAVVQYVVERAETTAEPQNTLLGLFSYNGSGMEARGFYMRRDVATGRYQLVYTEGGAATTVAWDLGAMQLPFRVRADGQLKTVPLRMEWQVTVADRQRVQNNVITYAVPVATQTLMFGVSLATTGSNARATFSDFGVTFP